jgi:hypothetical protein
MWWTGRAATDLGSADDAGPILGRSALLVRPVAKDPGAALGRPITSAEPIAIANTENALGRGDVMRSDRRIETHNTLFPQIADPKRGQPWSAPSTLPSTRSASGLRRRKCPALKPKTRFGEYPGLSHLRAVQRVARTAWNYDMNRNVAQDGITAARHSKLAGKAHSRTRRPRLQTR